MDGKHDKQLLEDYLSSGSEEAFELIVQRHVNLVYSTALRQVRDPDTAKEITQTVFIILARKIRSLSSGVVLTGWLYRTTQFAAGRALRTERRRRLREQEAALMNTEPDVSTDSIWEQMAPLLEEGMSRLGDADRNALLLRYFENKSLREVGAAVGASEDTAQKRIVRAVEKLRGFFAKRGVVLSVIVIPAALSAHAVKAAPAGMVSAAALKGTAASVSTSALLHETLRLMTWVQIKSGVLMGAGVLLAVAASSFTVRQVVRGNEPQYQGQPLSYWLTGYDTQPGSSAWMMADSAVQAIGTNAVTTLLQMFRESDLAMNQPDERDTAYARVSAVSGNESYPVLPSSPALRHHLEAAFAFQALGPSASNAVPELIRIYQRNYSTLPALHDGVLEAIGGIGPAAGSAVPTLLNSLAILPEGDHANVLLELGKIHSEPNSVVPALVEALKDTSPLVRRYALFALAQYGPEARSAVPALEQIEADSKQDPTILQIASQALNQIVAADAKEQTKGDSH